jgi:hypothetical protein
MNRSDNIDEIDDRFGSTVIINGWSNYRLIIVEMQLSVWVGGNYQWLEQLSMVRAIINR